MTVTKTDKKTPALDSDGNQIFKIPELERCAYDAFQGTCFNHTKVFSTLRYNRFPLFRPLQNTIFRTHNSSQHVMKRFVCSAAVCQINGPENANECESNCCFDNECSAWQWFPDSDKSVALSLLLLQLMDTYTEAHTHATRLSFNPRFGCYNGKADTCSSDVVETFTGGFKTASAKKVPALDEALWQPLIADGSVEVLPPLALACFLSVVGLFALRLHAFYLLWVEAAFWVQGFLLFAWRCCDMRNVFLSSIRCIVTSFSFPC